MAVELLDRSGSAAAAPLEEGVVGWLSWMSQLLSDWSWLGVIEFSDNAETETVVHGFPRSKFVPQFAEELARRACATGNAVHVRLQNTPSDTEERCVLAMPLPMSVDGSHRALLLTGASHSAEQRAATIKLCRWACVWLDQLSSVKTLRAAAGSDSLSDAVLNAFEKQGSAQSVAIAIATAVKRLCGCKRVSVASTDLAGGAKGLKLIALSDQVQVDARRVLPAQIRSAMKECISGAGIVSYPGEEGAQIFASQLPAHAALFEDQGACPSLSLVFSEIRSIDGSGLANRRQNSPADCVSIALLLERPPGQPFTSAQIAAIRLLLAPGMNVLRSVLYQEMNSMQRLLGNIRRTMQADFWSRLNLQQWSKLAAGVLLLTSLIVPVSHRVSANAAIQAKDLQVLIAPQSGFIAASHARAGDSVEKGQLLATLDTRELRLSVNKWRSEASKNRQARNQALATRDKVKLAGLRADATRIAAELALTESQLARTELRAPFDGVVLSGDLSRLLGAAVVQGDTLFTIASSDEYELVLDVEEQDVGLVSAGQLVRVRMAALPDETWQASVESVLPVAVATSDGNAFKVPAELADPSPRLRPGMEGVAKLYVGKRSMAWVYTRTLREQFRLLLWRLGVIR